MMVRVAGLLFAVFFVALCGQVRAQVTAWDQRQSVQPPPPRYLHAMSRGPVNQAAVLFGGFDGQLRGDTWLWDGGDWSLASSSGGPSPRRRHAMAFDAARGVVVLFGGEATGLLGDTWTWNGTSWTQQATSVAPAARSGHAMAFDSVRQRVVLFGGGIAGGQGVADTWLWDGVAWVSSSAVGAPVGRSGHALEWSEANHGVLMFGGLSPSIGSLADTWLWNGQGWIPMFSAHVPPARSGHCSARLAIDNSIIVFGGDASQALADAWRWTGSDWTTFTTPGLTPSARWGHACASGDLTQGAVLFGGFDGSVILGDTWVLGSGGVYGAGCGTPPLQLVSDSTAPPQLGQVARAQVLNAPTPFAGMAIGEHRDFIGPFPLPLPLASLGMPGCDLWQSAEIVGLPVVATGSGMQFALPIPISPALVGLHLYLQAYALAPGANAASIIVSNGLEWGVSCAGSGSAVVVEDFSTSTYLDLSASAGGWGSGSTSFATIGGDARHGEFSLALCTDTGLQVDGKDLYELDCDSTVIPAVNTTTGSALAITDGRFFFSSMVVPSNVLLRFTGTTPPVVTVAGRLEVLGVIDASGQSLTSVPGSTTTVGQLGGFGGIFAGAGGNGGDKCLGVGPGAGNFDGNDGGNARLIAGHAYLGALSSTGGRGSDLFPASGLNIDMMFATNPPPTTPLHYALNAVAGGSGGGLFTAGGSGFVESIKQNGVPIANESAFKGPSSTAGAAAQLFPFPPATGLQRSSLHFLAGGAGGGGAASNSTLALALARQWAPGGGGGGGGGAFALRAGRSLRVTPTGKLLAKGGSAANNIGAAAGPQVAPGGGGSGGSIVLQSGGSADLEGEINVSGGSGGLFSKTGGGGTAPGGGVVEIHGGDGGNGMVRFELPTTPPLTALTSMSPAPVSQNVGSLTELDDLVAIRSKAYVISSVCPPVFQHYVIEATVDGASMVFSDDASISTQPAGVGAPVRAFFQGVVVDPVTGSIVDTGSWRGSVGNWPGQSGIAADGMSAFRFQLVIDRTLATTVDVTRVEVAFLQ
ncbi:MAG: hypothetical protein R3F29_03985 [Planctomycetota bacterium]